MQCLRLFRVFLLNDSIISLIENITDYSDLKPISDNKTNFANTKDIFDEMSWNEKIEIIIDELYSSPSSSKTKIKKLLQQIKLLNDQEVMNSLFISIFQNIKVYIKEKRSLLHKKLDNLELNNCTSGRITTRRHSVNCLRNCSEYSPSRINDFDIPDRKTSV